MSETDIETLKLLFNSLFNSLKEDIHKDIENIHISIRSYQEKTNLQSVLIEGMRKDIDNTKKDIETTNSRLVENFEQHKTFYDNFKQMDRLIYKIVGGILVGSVLITVAVKLIG